MFKIDETGATCDNVELYKQGKLRMSVSTALEECELVTEEINTLMKNLEFCEPVLSGNEKSDTAEKNEKLQQNLARIQDLLDYYTALRLAIDESDKHTRVQVPMLNRCLTCYEMLIMLQIHIAAYHELAETAREQYDSALAKAMHLNQELFAKMNPSTDIMSGNLVGSFQKFCEQNWEVCNANAAKTAMTHYNANATQLRRQLQFLLAETNAKTIIDIKII